MRPVLIAELCQNHNGDKETLKRMIHEAAAAGADFVKIQAIRSRELAFRERFEVGAKDEAGRVTVIQRPFAAEKARLERLDLPLDLELWFVDECRRAGVASMTTFFTRTAVRELADAGYSAAKIASYDCRSLPLLRDVAARWSTVFVSTGASLDEEVAAAASVLAGRKFHLLHCVTIYPTPLEELHLRRMDWLRRFTHRVGFSDHTKPAADSVWASKAALAFDASCVERHFTVLEPGATRDGPVSITPAMLRELRLFADRPRTERMEILRRDLPDWEKTLGQAHRPLSATELLNRDYYAGRFVNHIDGRELTNWEEAEIEGHAG
jgi:sialic acid synthase SpsE